MGTKVRSDQDVIPEVGPRPACNDGTGRLAELFFSEDVYDIARA